jgi:AcrR family transcriptional regulator
LFSAGAEEFAARGFAGANVDRIAAAARVNKAMLYYHFKSKAGLYGEVLRDMFHAVATRVAETAKPGSSPEDRIRAIVEAIAREAEARPHFPAIWLREIAEGATHVDKPTMAIIGGILQQVAGALKDGVASKQFVPANPLLVQFGIVGPLLLFFATASLRRKAPPQLAVGADLTTEQVIAHVQRVALLTLGRQPS